MAVDLFARTGHAELDDALALMERAHTIIEGAASALEDVGPVGAATAIGHLERAQVNITTAAEVARLAR